MEEKNQCDTSKTNQMAGNVFQRLPRAENNEKSHRNELNNQIRPER